MAVEKVGVYRKWVGPPPQRDGKPASKAEGPKKRRHRWVVRWYGTHGKRYGKVFDTRKEAQRYAAKLQDRVSLGKPDRPKKITLHDFKREHGKVMRGQVAFSTLQDHIRALELFENFIGGSVVLYKIQPRHAEAFIARRLASGLSVATVNKDIRTLRRIFNLAIDPRGYIAEGQNPFARIRERKKTKTPVRYVATEEYRKLLATTKKLWWKTFISVAYGSGLRRNEILNLTWRDIDFVNNRINVQAKKRTAEMLEWEPKDHENRLVPMAEVTAQLLADMQTQAVAGHPYVFILPERLGEIKKRRANNDWTPRSEIVNNLIRDFDVIRRRAGVADCTLHDLRRSAITNWAQRLPIQVVQQLAGHTDIGTTRKYYLSVRSEDLAAANELLNNILAGKYDD